MKRLSPRQLRSRGPTPEERASLVHQPLSLVLDNVVDAFNTGALFRLACSIGAAKVYLCGRTPTPPHPKVHRAAVGTETWVPWEYHVDTAAMLKQLRATDERLALIAVEQDPRSIPYAKLGNHLPAAIIIGHETHGVLPEVLSLADLIVELPMFGVTRSLNVVASAAVVAYKLLESHCRWRFKLFDRV